MKIKSIELTNHPVFGNIDFDFTNDQGDIVDTIILAGENGTGKTSFLNLIYDLGIDVGFYNGQVRNEKRTFTFCITNQEKGSLLNLIRPSDGTVTTLSTVSSDRLSDEIVVELDYSSYGNYNLYFNIQDLGEINTGNNFFHNGSFSRFMKSLYSTTEINFEPQEILSITATVIDEEVKRSIKSDRNLANNITQLIVDIDSQDNADLSKWVKNNPKSVPPEEVKEIRIKRFANAFESIFPSKKFGEVRAKNGKLKVFFKEHLKEMSIENLSSGEKQIVFRGGFLLKNMNSIEGAIILIDEPEISLHPDWQKKILNFFQALFTDASGQQTSQLFVSTHSPFIIHNDNRTNDKVIILKKDLNGNIFTQRKGEFYNWTEKEIVEEAFNLKSFQDHIPTGDQPLIITEGKTDWKHLKRALKKFHDAGIFDELNFSFHEYEDSEAMGSPQLLKICEAFSKIDNKRKFIAVFDRDEKDMMKKVSIQGKSFKSWGNNVFSFTIPVPHHRRATPEISIEHYYTDEEIKTSDPESRRLYLGNEFKQSIALHVEKDRICKLKNKCGPNSIAIIDDGVVLIDDETESNITLSKNNFAQHIYNESEPFKNINHENFKYIFEIIKEIITEN